MVLPTSLCIQQSYNDIIYIEVVIFKKKLSIFDLAKYKCLPCGM
jgi:hypothetical protein